MYLNLLPYLQNTFLDEDYISLVYMFTLLKTIQLTKRFNLCINGGIIIIRSRYYFVELLSGNSRPWVYFLKELYNKTYSLFNEIIKTFHEIIVLRTNNIFIFTNFRKVGGGALVESNISFFQQPRVYWTYIGNSYFKNDSFSCIFIFAKTSKNEFYLLNLYNLIIV